MDKISKVKNEVAGSLPASLLFLTTIWVGYLEVRFEVGG